MNERYFLINNSQLFFQQREEGNQIEILVEESKHQLTKVYQIPNPLWVEEVESNFKEKDKTKLVACYQNQEKKGCILEIIDIDLKRKEATQKESIVAKDYPSIIYPGIYFYENENGSMCLRTAYQKEMIPEKYFTRFFNDFRILKKVEIHKLEESSHFYFSNFVEMLLHIGTEEVLHIYVQLPTEPYEEFLVFKYIGSEMTNKEYCLWNDEQGEDYANFYTFMYYFSESDLAKEIIYIQKYQEEKLKEQRQKTKSRLLKHLSNQELF